MTTTHTGDENRISVSIGRQPIFNENRRLWGYALYCVGNAETAFGLPEEDTAAINVASSAYMGLQQIVDRGRKVIIHFSEKNILDKLPYALPPSHTALDVAEEIYHRPSVPELLDRMKSDGYLISVAAFSGNDNYSGFYGLADVIGIDVLDQSRGVLEEIVAIARPYGALLLARGVKGVTQFEMCRELGFSLFHGAFFKSPDEVTVRKLSSNEVSRFNLLRVMQLEEPDFVKLAETMQTDVSISFRLLTYLNSAVFGFPQKIKSINQAISLLGWQNMKNWLRVVLLTDMSQNKHASELVTLAAQRGQFLERIVRDHDFWGFDPESLHLLGIFSLLDTMIGIPMPEVVAYLPLDNKLKSALCRESNNEYLPLLLLAEHFEEARWGEAEKMIQQLNLDRTKVTGAFQASIDWAGSLAALNTKTTNGRA